MVPVPKRSAKEDVLGVQEHCGLLGSASSHTQPCAQREFCKDVGFSVYGFTDNCSLPFNWRRLASFWKLQ